MNTTDCLDFLSIGTMLKARPSEECGERFIYLEASKEDIDQQNEVVLAKALEESADHFLKFGSIDIDHKSMPPIARKYGIQDPESWEIGVPVEVRADAGSVFVKGRLYSGDTPLATRANMVWDSLTKLTPAARWYPSVGGSPLARREEVDPISKSRVGYVTRLRWTNLAISRQPVNQHVAAANTVPFGALAKCWDAAHGLNLAKALEASYETDVAQRDGGGAFGQQSLDQQIHHSYHAFRDHMAKAIREGRLGTPVTIDGMTAHAAHEFALSPDVAAGWVNRFLAELKAKLSSGDNQ